MISIGFDYLNVHNPHIVCDKGSVVLTFTPSPDTFPLREIPEILSLKHKHIVLVLLAYISYILYNSKGRENEPYGINVADTTTTKK